jgi:hypothetical protein
MPITTTTVTAAVDVRIHCGPARRCTALIVALDAARTRLDDALADLHALVADGELCADAAGDLEREYVARHLRRVAELEQRGALACTPDEWLRFVTTAARHEAAITRASEQRHRARMRRATRHSLVVAPGRITDPAIAMLVDRELDTEAQEIRAELAAAALL